ncbi:MAG TPA: Wzz/FepE/Etk N-terminal domain-containing protein [Candidatus Solibacter sp.]|nr:Wzz/FepE/Etk N-terminal domain-containing protein [Candidatus Solibacter sp.]
MIRNGDITISDVKRMVRKHWWIPVLTTTLLAAAGFAATLVLPKKFKSTTVVLVEQPTVPIDIVKPVVNDDLNHRLSSMSEQVLSRTRLQSVIEKLNLYPGNQSLASKEDAVDRLRKTITVELMQPMNGSDNRQPPGFHVSVTYDNPHLAQQICTEITSMFMEQNVRRREQQSSATTDFLSQQLDEAKAKLDEQDAKLAEFKRKNIGALPEEEQTNLNLLTGLNTQLDAATQGISRAQQEKVATETMLSSQESLWKATQTGQQNPETQEQQLAALQDQLTVLLAKYTPEHPDVIKLKAQIAEMKKKIDADPLPKANPAGTQTATHEPPQLQQLRAKLKQDEIIIADLMKRQNQIQEQIRILQGRVQASPLVEQQFKEMTRSHQSALDFYNDLLKKRDTSAMATDLEHQQESETFRVLDPPSLPESPSFPKPLLFVGGGLGAGLALGVAIMYLLAMMDKAMYSERDVELCLKVPVLAMIQNVDVTPVVVRGLQTH